jgi:putative hydroxymethylpyrimidine transport system substrate-binding protein
MVFFSDQGLKVTFVTPLDTISSEKMVAMGRADIALTYQPSFIYHAASGLPLIRFATLVASPLNCIVALKNGQIKKLQDLKGKKNWLQ